MRAILFLLFMITKLSAFQYELSVVSVFHNEARFLKEWIEYNRLIGVDHFWLYNNESEDDYAAILEPYIKAGVVELFNWPTNGEKKDFASKTQAPAFMDAVNRSKDITRWLAMIDLDEFMVPKEGQKITTILANHFNTEVGVVMYWQMFGTSYYEKLGSKDLMIEKLTLRAPENHILHTMFKSIVNPRKVGLVENPHFAHFLEGKAVNTLGKLTDPLNEKENYTIHLIQLNHYWTRDLYNIVNIKWPRLQQLYGSNDFDGYLQEIEVLNAEEDTEILKFIPQLRKKMR